MFTIVSNPKLDSDHLEEATEILGHTVAHPLACLNWPEAFPEFPQVNFQIAHNGRVLFIRYNVKETSTRALVTEDNGEVWTDSCVELFLALDDSGYYNFEFSCIGKVLEGFHTDRFSGTRASSDVLSSIGRWSSLGTENFGEISLPAPWQLTVAIPVTALFKHRLSNWGGIEARMNLYKCGNRLSRPQYLSWSPVRSPKPDFHRPEFFAKVRFLSVP